MEVEEGRPRPNHSWVWNEMFHIAYHPRGCKICMEYGRHLMEADFAREDDYVAVVEQRRDDREYWQKRASKYVDDLDDADASIRRLTARVKELEQELEDVHDYVDKHGGKWA